MIMLNFK